MARKTSKQGFAGMDEDRPREIANQGGGSFKEGSQHASEAGKRGAEAQST